MRADSTPVRLLQITDTHLFAQPDKTLYGINPRDTLRRVLAAAARHPGPDLVLATGDLVHDESPAGYRALAAMLQTLAAPVAAIAGNHDAPAALRANLPADFRVGGVQALGGWRIVLLNTSVPGKDSGHLDKSALEFLRAALSAAAGCHALVVLHHQPVPVGSPWLDRIALDNPEEFFAVLDCFEQVRGVLWGHVHQIFESQRRGVRLLATPSTCAQFLPGAEKFTADDKPPGMRWLSLQADGRIETRVEWVTDE